MMLLILQASGPPWTLGPFPTPISSVLHQIGVVCYAPKLARNLPDQTESWTDSAPMMLLILQVTDPPQTLIIFPTPISSVLHHICQCVMHPISGMCYAPRSVECVRCRNMLNVLCTRFTNVFYDEIKKL
jgi:hypothetical protein